MSSVKPLLNLKNEAYDHISDKTFISGKKSKLSKLKSKKRNNPI